MNIDPTVCDERKNISALLPSTSRVSTEASNGSDGVVSLLFDVRRPRHPGHEQMQELHKPALSSKKRSILG